MLQTKPETYQRRRQLWVEKSFQNKVVWHFVLTVILSIFCSHLITVFYIRLRDFLNPAAENLIYFSNAINENLEFSRALEILWLPLLTSALVGIVLVLFVGLFFSHRMAGPIFNLKRVMRQVEEGNLDVTMHIRKTDEFHDVEEGFNQMVKGLNQRLNRLQEAIAGLPAAEKKKLEKALKEFHFNG